uniref:Putative secreted protein n=1 Tax=Ixodes ricinus TaxID=34613 RepID=A0A147BMZ3_IXORI
MAMVPDTTPLVVAWLLARPMGAAVAAGTAGWAGTAEGVPALLLLLVATITVTQDLGARDTAGGGRPPTLLATELRWLHEAGGYCGTRMGWARGASRGRGEGPPGTTTRWGRSTAAVPPPFRAPCSFTGPVLGCTARGST